MYDVVVLGGAGELGSNFAKLCIDRGYDVKIIDITRYNEAWRLKWLGIESQVDYLWKSSFDISTSDIDDAGLILDCACQPDRPLGISSPNYTLVTNLHGPARLLEAISNLPEKPTVLYPSSSNIFLGVPPEQQPLVESTKPVTINYYAWSKLAAEQMYLTYNNMQKNNNIIIRTGSCYGPGMRSDQMIGKCILNMLKDRDFSVKSPKSSRTYTYTADVLKFYELLLEKLENDEYFLEPYGNVIHNGGNKENISYRTMDIAEMIRDIVGSGADLIPDEYENGEQLPDGRPVQQWEKSEIAEKLLGWCPTHTINDGLIGTVEWFSERINNYI